MTPSPKSAPTVKYFVASEVIEFKLLLYALSATFHAAPALIGD